MIKDCLLLQPGYRCRDHRSLETSFRATAFSLGMLVKVHVSCRTTPARLSSDYQALPGGLVSSSGLRAVHGRERVTESGHLKRMTLLCRARLQPAECVARTDAHGGCAGDERLMEEWLDRIAECRIATCEQT